MKPIASTLFILVFLIQSLANAAPAALTPTKSPGGIISQGPVSIGTSSSPNPSAALDVVSTTKGLAIPRMTQSQRDAISSPALGLQIYNTDLQKFNYWNGTAWKEIGSGAGGGGGTCGLLSNCSFEDAGALTSGWTAGSGVTSAASTTAATDGLQSVTLTLSSTNGAILSQSPTQLADYTGFNLEFSAWAKTSLSGIQVCALQGGSEVNCVAVPSTNAWTLIDFNLPGTNATQGIRVKSTSSVSGDVSFDGTYVGYAKNLGAVSQASYFGGMEQPGSVSTCYYTENTSSGLTDFVTLGSGSGCTAWAASGSVSAVGTNDHSVVLNNMGVGNFRIDMIGNVAVNAAQACVFRLTDGTTAYQPQIINQTGANASPILSFNVNSPSSATRTYSIQASDSGSGNCTIDNSFSGSNIAWEVYYYPLQSQTVTPNTLDSLGQIFYTASATCPAGSEAADGGTTTNAALISRMGSSTRPDLRGIFIRGAGTNAVSGFADANGSAYTATLGAYTGDQLQGHNHMVNLASVAGTAPGLWAGNDNGGNNPLAINGNGAGSTGQNIVADGTNGSPRYGVETRPANLALTACISTATQAAPLVIGGVSTPDMGAATIFAAHFEGSTANSSCTSNPCTVSRASGSGTIATRASAGVYNVAFPTGTFSAQPWSCTCSAFRAAVGAEACTAFTSSATAVDINAHTGNAVFADAFVDVTCVGPK